MKHMPTEVTKNKERAIKCATIMGTSTVMLSLFLRTFDILLRESQSKIKEAIGETNSAISY